MYELTEISEKTRQFKFKTINSIVHFICERNSDYRYELNFLKFEKIIDYTQITFFLEDFKEANKYFSRVEKILNIIKSTANPIIYKYPLEDNFFTLKILKINSKINIDGDVYFYKKVLPETTQCGGGKTRLLK